MNNREKIKQLQEQIWELEKQETLKNQDKILPFLRENVVFEYYYPNRLEIELLDKEKCKQLINLISNRDQGYHFGCSIDKEVDIRYDDGDLALYFNFSGPVKEFPERLVRKVKELGLKLNFNKAKDVIKRNIEKQEFELNKINKIEELYKV